MQYQNIIRIKKASFYGYHGVFREEQHVGGKFEADVTMYTDFAEAAQKDDLTKTIDYEKVYNLMHEVVVQKKYYLLESVAERIAGRLLENYPLVTKVEVRIRKNNPPIGGVVDCVEIEVIRER